MGKSGKSGKAGQKAAQPETVTPASPQPQGGQERVAATPAPAAEPAEEEKSAGDTVTELANTQQGCWKVDVNGRRIELTDAQWREELARLLAHRPTED